MGWPKVPFEQAIVPVKYLRKIPKKQFLETGQYPIVSQEEGLINGYWDNAEDILTGISPVIIFGDHTKVVKYIDFDFAVGADGVKVLKPVEGIYPKFFKYFIESLNLRDLGYARHYKLLKEILVPVPCIEEQKRIVTMLDEAFADIDKARKLTEQNLKNARELYESYLQASLSDNHVVGNDTNLGNEVELLTGFAFKSKEYVTYRQSIPLLRGDNIIQGELRWDGVKRWPIEKASAYAKYYLKANDLVIAMDRTWIKAGVKYAMIKEEDLPAILVQRVARLRCLKALEPRYLYFLLGSKLFESYVLSIQTGLGVPHISGKQIKDFSFRNPPIEMQQEIIIKLESISKEVDRLCNIYSDKLTALDELESSLLKKAFSGELKNGLWT